KSIEIHEADRLVPDAAVANVSHFQHQVPGEFTLDVQNPVVDPRGPSSIQVDVRRGVVELAGRRADSRVDVLGIKIRRVVNQAIAEPERRFAKGRITEGDRVETESEGAACPYVVESPECAVGDAPTAADYGLGVQRIGKPKARSERP